MVFDNGFFILVMYVVLKFLIFFIQNLSGRDLFWPIWHVIYFLYFCIFIRCANKEFIYLSSSFWFDQRLSHRCGDEVGISLLRIEATGQRPPHRIPRRGTIK